MQRRRAQKIRPYPGSEAVLVIDKDVVVSIVIVSHRWTDRLYYSAHHCSDDPSYLSRPPCEELGKNSVDAEAE